MKKKQCAVVAETHHGASLPGLQPFLRLAALGVCETDGGKRMVVNHILVDLEKVFSGGGGGEFRTELVGVQLV